MPKSIKRKQQESKTSSCKFTAEFRKVVGPWHSVDIFADGCRIGQFTFNQNEESKQFFSLMRAAGIEMVVDKFTGMK